MLGTVEEICLESLREGADGGGRPYVEQQTVPRSSCCDAKCSTCNERSEQISVRNRDSVYSLFSLPVGKEIGEAIDAQLI